MKISGTESEKNVMAVLDREAHSLCLYKFYAEIAKNEGHHEIAALFNRLAEEEMEHARTWFKALNGEGLSTTKCIEISASRESEEWKSLYPNYATKAREEHLEGLAMLFERVASIEFGHERRFVETLLQFNARDPLIEQTNEESHAYACVFCGYESNKLLDTCPVCGATDCFYL